MEGPDNRLIRELTNKTVHFQFMGARLEFALSHALFSSHDIDEGSKLLLKTIAQQTNPGNMRRIMDFGCGTGVLGLCLKKRFPAGELLAVDRDALALVFTAWNAARNGLGGVRLSGAVGLIGLPVVKFDLVVANLPAKAGHPVLESIVMGMPRFLAAEGLFALVIVKNLETLIEEALDQAGFEIRFREGTRGHTVFHSRVLREAAEPPSLDAFFRDSMQWPASGGAQKIDTVYGLAEFDTSGYDTGLLRKLLDRLEPEGRVLVYNPGQGHIPVSLLKGRGGRDLSLTLVGRDLLSLMIARHNWNLSGGREDRLETVHVPSLSSVNGEFDRLVLRPDDDAGVPWHRCFLAHALPLLKPGGLALTAARSSFLGRVNFSAAGLRIVKDLRFRGFRGLVLRKPK